LFYGYKNQSRPVANRSRPELVKTGLVTAKDCKRLVSRGSVQFFEVSRFGRTGYGYGLRYWAPKDRTGPDFQTLCSQHVWGFKHNVPGSGKTTEEALVKVFHEFAPPETFMMDGGPHFDNKVVREFCVEWGTETHVVSAYLLWVNGLVEGTNKYCYIY